MESRCFVRLALLLPVLLATGCGSFVAHRMAQAPNTYPTWLAPKAPVELGLNPRLLTDFPTRFVDVGPPPARLHFRIVEPADYELRVTSTNWMARGRSCFRFDFKANIPAQTNVWTASPRGTVILLHGYGLAEWVMAPWALRLAQEGCRCVLVELRGHGESTGRRIFYGLKETQDLSQLLNELGRNGELAQPVAAMGESYGAALALRWKSTEPRVTSVVAIAPYAVLSNAVLNLCHEYSPWLPRALLNAGLGKLASLLHTEPAQLNTSTILSRSPVTALFVAGEDDRIMPLAYVRGLFEQAAPGSKLLVVPKATHEAVPYFFDALVPVVVAWLDSGQREPRRGSSSGPPPPT